MKKIYAAVSPDVSRREIENRNRSRLIAAEGMVLLENNGILPLKLKEAKIALFGNGARHTVSGGTGSGEVNAREVSSVEQGLEHAGAVITTKICRFSGTGILGDVCPSEPFDDSYRRK